MIQMMNDFWSILGPFNTKTEITIVSKDNRTQNKYLYTTKLNGNYVKDICFALDFLTVKSSFPTIRDNYTQDWTQYKQECTANDSCKPIHVRENISCSAIGCYMLGGRLSL